MPGRRAPGADQDFYDWSALPFRPPLLWPNNARLALCVLITVDDWLIDPPIADPLLERLMQRAPGAPYPNLGAYTASQYSLRNGLFRVMRVLDQFPVSVAVAVDAHVALTYPFVVQECQRRGWEFVAHGLVGNAPLSNQLPPAAEEEYIQRSVDAIRQVTGATPRGWFGTDYQGSPRTLGQLAKAGVRYVLDWPNDEQPYRMRADGAQLLSLPVLLELDDQYVLLHRRITAWRWERSVKDAFDLLYAEGERNARLFILSLHPSVIGRAFRIRSLETVLAYMCARDGVWSATPADIAESFEKSGVVMDPDDAHTTRSVRNQ
jgi:hypothetical protein